jgi:hypothetical protein
LGAKRQIKRTAHILSLEPHVASRVSRQAGATRADKVAGASKVFRNTKRRCLREEKSLSIVSPKIDWFELENEFGVPEECAVADLNVRESDCKRVVPDTGLDAG